MSPAIYAPLLYYWFKHFVPLRQPKLTNPIIRFPRLRWGGERDYYGFEFTTLE